MTLWNDSSLPVPTNTGPSLMTLGALRDDELALVERLMNRLAIHQPSNEQKALYYEGDQYTETYGIAIPANKRQIRAVSGWSGTVVDTLEERLDFEGWVGTKDDLGLKDIFRTNSLEVDATMGHLDALIYGTAFATVGAGLKDGDDPLITVESPTAMTGLYSPRTRLLTSALVQRTDDLGEEIVEAVLYLPMETVYMSRQDRGGPWRIDDRDDHKMNRVPVAQFLNRPRAGRMSGRSEISKTVRYFSDVAVRTMEASEVNREFYTSPQRYVLGASEDAFTSSDGSDMSGWQTIMGAMLALDRDAAGELPQVGQFPQSSQGPYMETLRGAAQMIAAESGIPSSYLGFISDNPSSADAIRTAEARLIKRSERRQSTLGRAWDEVGYLALLVRDGVVPKDFDQISVKWADPATPTRSAAADEAVKLISSGVLTPDSTVTYDRIGLSQQEQRQLEHDKKTSGMANIMARLSGQQVTPQVEQLTTRQKDVIDE